MRCKPGDIAIIIKGYRPEIGMSVTCLRLAGAELQTPDGPRRTVYGGKPIWEIDRPITWSSRKNGDVLLPYAPDAILLPIRPQPEEVESEGQVSA